MNVRKRAVRRPQQKRGVERKEQILQAAYEYVCANGYSEMTTPKLAKAAGVSVGCLYGYFEDKDDLFQAVLDRYARQFDAMREAAFRKLRDPDVPVRRQLLEFLSALVATHEASKELNAEMRQLSFRDRSMRARLEEVEVKVQRAIRRWLLDHRSEIAITDVDARAVILMDMASSLVDRVVFGRMPVSKSRLLKEGVDALLAVVGMKHD